MGDSETEKRAKNAAKMRRYRATHGEQLRAYDRARYAKHGAEKRAYEQRPERKASRARRMAAARAADPEAAARQFRAWNYGLDPDEMDRMLAGGCAACGGVDRLHIDHDHSCCPDGAIPRSCGACVRGILCHWCNTALGLLREDPARLRALLAYLGD